MVRMLSDWFQCLRRGSWNKDVLALNALPMRLQEWIDDLNLGGLIKLQLPMQVATKAKLQGPRILSRLIILQISIRGPNPPKLRNHREVMSRFQMPHE